MLAPHGLACQAQVARAGECRARPGCRCGGGSASQPRRCLLPRRLKFGCAGGSVILRRPRGCWLSSPCAGVVDRRAFSRHRDGSYSAWPTWISPFAISSPITLARGISTLPVPSRRTAATRQGKAAAASPRPACRRAGVAEGSLLKRAAPSTATAIMPFRARRWSPRVSRLGATRPSVHDSHRSGARPRPGAR